MKHQAQTVFFLYNSSNCRNGFFNRTFTLYNTALTKLGSFKVYIYRA